MERSPGALFEPEPQSRRPRREEAVTECPRHDPGKPNNLPFRSLGSLFKGRETFLDQLHEALRAAEGRALGIVPAQAIHGLGGVGKTRLAVEYAWRHVDEYEAVLFVTADFPANLQQNLAALCGLLDLAEKEATETEVQADAVVRWLWERPGWLLILDNADTEGAAQAAEDLLDRLQSAGQVLVTSRLSDWSGAVETMALDVLAETAAARFLLERTDRPKGRRKTPEDEGLARDLASELGHLALALEQAGAYICQQRLTFAQYLEAWYDNRDKVIEWHDQRLMKYPRSVAVTWQTSFDQLSEPARRLLERLAWLAPDPIPESLLDVPPSSFVVPASAGSSEDRVNADAQHLRLQAGLHEALAELETYSLVTRSGESPTFTVHRLVQDVTRRSLRDDAEHRALTESLRWINAAFVGDPQDVRTWPTLDPMAPHARAVAQHADQRDIDGPAARLMGQLGMLLDVKAQHAEAEPLMRRALAIDEQSYGPEHPEVATDLNNLAQLLHATNRLSEAEPLMRRALQIDEQSYGPRHPYVAVHLNNLAQLLQATNRLREAEPLMRRALAIDERSYGADRPAVARDLNNLAALLKETNRLAEAEPLMRRALAIDEQSYGPEHPDVAIDLSNLAQLLEATNRLSEAEPLMRRALAIDEEAYGPEHPSVACVLNNLAALLHATNRLSEAESLMRRALAIDEEAYGPEHTKVASDLSNLAALLEVTERLTEAESLMRRALAIDEQSYGPEHPSVAIRVNNLAALLHATNHLSEAEPLMRRALAIDEQSYGPEPPNFAHGLNNLAWLLKDMERWGEAEPLMRRALEASVASLGEEHPDARTVMKNYRGLLQEMGLPPDEIERRLREAMEPPSD